MKEASFLSDGFWKGAVVDEELVDLQPPEASEDGGLLDLFDILYHGGVEEGVVLHADWYGIDDEVAGWLDAEWVAEHGVSDGEVGEEGREGEGMRGGRDEELGSGESVEFEEDVVEVGLDLHLAFDQDWARLGHLELGEDAVVREVGVVHRYCGLLDVAVGQRN